jgi:predicted ArsR family transcriptional regulator
MLEAFKDRQQVLLKFLLKEKRGISIDEIAVRVQVTRPAVRKHLSALEKLGYVEQSERFTTGGRPGQTYRLTKKGYDLFPKQYSWISDVLMESLHSQLGDQGLGELMDRLGTEVGGQNLHQVQGKNLRERVEQVAKLMNELAYQAETALTGREFPGSPPVIEASNCVFHSIAERFPEICKFDLALLSKLTGAQVVHEKCILRGEGTCRFRFKEKA